MSTQHDGDGSKASESLEGFRISPRQRDLWRWQIHGTAYCSQCVVLVEGRLDEAVLEHAVRAVIGGHEILRTTFHVPEGLRLPVQVIGEDGRGEEATALLRRAECSGEAGVEAVLENDRSRPFDLRRGPVLRLSLVRRSESESLLLVTLPALCGDTRTLKNLARDLGRLYDSSSLGGEEDEAPIQYADAAAWMNGREEEDDEEGRLYWSRQELARVPELRLPFERRDAVEGNLSPRSVPLRLGPRQVARYDAAARARGSSVEAFVLTGWQVLLRRVSGCSEVVVGSLCDGRPLEPLESGLGLYERFLPVRGVFTDAASFHQAMASTHRTLEANDEWQESFPPESPFFDYAFQYEDRPAVWSFSGVVFSIRDQHSCTAPFKLKLSWSSLAGGARLSLEYDAARFARRDVRLLARQLETLLDGAAAEPEATVSELDLLRPSDRHRLSLALNDTARELASAVLSHELFEAQVERTPEAPAVLLGDELVSYRELDRRADELARELAGHGVAAETPVGLCLERSVAMAVAVLAVWKAGGAYVALDPDAPPRRLAALLQEAGARLVVTRERWLGVLPKAGIDLVRVDRPSARGAGGAGAEVAGARAPERLAYVVHTSGSTGRPKGIAATHGGVVNYLSFLTEAYRLTGQDVVLQLASLSFDASVRDLVGPLLSGAKVVLVDDMEAISPAAILARLEERRVTCVLSVVPTLLREILSAAGEGGSFARLRLVLASGESLYLSDGARLRKALGEHVRLVNQYGPSECTMTSTYWPVAAERGETGAAFLGRPVANARVFVVDKSSRLAPPGVVGELCIAGAGLARGYVARAARTAAAFRPEPVGRVAGARLYHTGDLARMLPEGELELLGRLDHQLKIRGVRVEPGEVEDLLARHRRVRAVAVTARDDLPGGPGLVAWVVAREHEGLAGELRHFLRQRLPESMVPAAFVPLDVLPVTANLKVDRRALRRQDLPEPGAAESGAAGRFIGPRTPLEELLAGVVAEVLGLARVSTEDSFFDLGGHSLLATQVMARVRELFQVELPLRTVFEVPTVAALARRIETAQRQGRGLARPPLRPVSRDGRLPASFAQERLWFLHQLDPESPAYNMATAVRLLGAMDVPVLETTVKTLVGRHEVLRTCFEEVDGNPVQVIAGEVPVRIPLVDLGALAGEHRETLLPEIAAREARRPFVLSRAPLLRVTLVLLGPLDQALLLTVHHTVSDAWSIGLFVRELTVLYTAVAQRRPSPLPRLGIQYADYAVWQRQWLRGEVLERHLAYWRRKLSGMPTLELPLDRRRPPIQTFRGSTLGFALPAGLARSLRALARQHRVSLYTSLLATLDVLLARHAGQDDVVVGSPIAQRSEKALEDLIGLFVNTLVLRADVSGPPPSGEPAFGDLLARVGETTLEAYTHQDLPFERLVDALQPERDPSRNPLFQVMFNLQNTPRGELASSAFEIRPMPGARARAIFDLTLAVTESGPDLSGWWEYNRDLFDAVTVRRLSAGFLRLLEAAVERPGSRLSELPLLGAAQCQQLLREWNDTAVAGGWQPVHELFAAQAERRPAAVALDCGRRQVSYAALNARADGLAHRLRHLGVGPEVLVGVALERSAWMPVALLGILKAGGAYVPLDPTHPARRLALVLEDSAPRVLLTDASSRAALPATAARVFDAGRLEAGTAKRAPRSAVRGEQTAYVIYTSGSTGRPKGVDVRHAGLASFLRSMAREPGLTAADTLAALTTLSFDIAGLELFLPLSVGARVRILGGDEAADPQELASRLADARATVMQATPATWQMLSDAGWENPAGVKVLCGGEALAPELARRLTACSRSVWNLYGPTETTIWSAVARVESPGAGPRDGAGPASIGRPIAGTRILVLDRRGLPAPAGVPGELAIGGRGVARGYRGRPALTAAAFVPDPVAARAGERFYRTGDLARSDRTGRLEFLGRIDHQVKVRGFRIELGEVEAALGRHPDVRRAVVLVREATGTGGRSVDRRLVAYFVAAGASSPTLGDLRRFLGERLPGYMLPDAVVKLDELPLTPNGKVDRRRLPAPEAERPELDKAFQEPRNPVERAVAEIWCQVLGRERVGAFDSFFELGGHSLRATQVNARVFDTFRVKFPLRRFFDEPTVAALAETIGEELAAAGAGRRGDAADEQQIPRLAPADHYPLSFAQERLWLLHLIEPESPAYNVSSAVRLEGCLDVAALRRGFDAVVRRHATLRTALRTEDGLPVQVVAAAVSAAWPLIDLRRLPEALGATTLQRLVRWRSRRLFDLSRPPLLRVTLLRLAARRHVLLVTMHHVVSDRWSLGLLVKELALFYEAFRTGSPAPLPELDVQYTDFAVWQRRRLSRERLEPHLAYWRHKLAGMPALELATDRPRPSVPSSRGAAVRHTLEADLSTALATLARRRGASLFMTLLAAYKVLLAGYSAQRDLAVGTPVANRPRSELEGLIGPFLNTLVLRTQTSGDPTFQDFLARVRESALEAFAHQELPFERLVEALSPQRDLSRNPLFQVMMALRNTPPPRLEPGGLSLEQVPVEVGTAQFDLTLAATPRRDGGLDLLLEYETDLFDPTTSRRLLRSYTSLLAAVVERPSRRLSALPLLGRIARHQILSSWNDSGPGAPFAAVHEQVARQVSTRPDAVAVRHGGTHLAYAALVASAGHLAARLRAVGVGPESLVAIFVERGPEMVVALLGVLGAGGAYLPLDPLQPRRRLSLLLAGAPLSAVVTRGRLASRLPEPGAPVLLVDERDSPPPVTAAPGVPATADQLAYVIYTSGSTGRPKGVMVSHGALANYTADVASCFEIGPRDVLLQFYSFAFDTSAEEILPCLARGATLVLLTEAMLSSPATFLAAAGDQKVTVLNVPTAYWHELAAGVGFGEATVPPTVRLTAIGGEEARREHWLQWQGAVRPSVRLLNVYGPTEVTIGATRCELSGRGERPGAGSRVPIGRPIAGVSCYVVDPAWRLSPPGVVGELLLGGVGCARGYLGAPGPTAERFAPDPFGRAGGARLYRTGDLVRQRADADLVFLGRADSQVKVRGYRIEPAEVEAVLGKHPAVRAAVVAAAGRQPSGPRPAGGERLVAYLVPRDAAAPPSVEDLRRFLDARLPDYMVPSAFVALERFALTPGGKVDREALPAPDAGRPGSAASFVAPRNPVERTVADTWCEVLGLDRVGARDDFFELGGHSLLATQVSFRLFEAFDVELPLRRFFDHPTVAALAEVIVEELAVTPRGGRRRAAPIPRLKPADHYPLSLAQERLWLLHRIEPDSPAYNLAAAVRLRGRLDVGSLERAFAALARRQASLRTVFRTVGGSPVQVVEPAAAVGLPRIVLRRLPEDLAGAEAERLVRRESRRLFDLSRAPLWRRTLLELAARHHVLLVTMHHIVSDGWSMGLLVQEVARLYEAFRDGAASPLARLPVRYVDFAVWQRERLGRGVLERQMAYWRRQLGGRLPVLDLPTARPRPVLRGFRAGTASTVLPTSLQEALHDLSRRCAASLFMTLLTAFKVLLHRLSGQNDVLVGSPVLGRDRRETEGLVGFFLNTLVLRTDFSRDAGFRELLEQVREVSLAAYAHQDVPFERLVEELQPERDLSRTPLFQVFFNMLNLPQEEIRLRDLAVEYFDVPEIGAKFDLTIYAQEIPPPLSPRQGISIRCVYNQDLFEPLQVEQMLEHYRTLLEAVVENPELRPAELPLHAATPEPPRAGGRPRRPDVAGFQYRELRGSMPRIFARRVDEGRDRIAVKSARSTWTYGELDARARQVTGALGQRRAAAGRVALLFEHDAPMIAAMLGTLGAAAAYVPLDPRYPRERLAYVLRDSEAAFLLTHREHLALAEELVGTLASHRRPALLDFDGLQAAAAAPVAESDADGLAYVLYTSGSTGRPKGVMQSRRNMLRQVRAYTDALRIGPADRLSQLSSYAFDASVVDVYGALLSGATLYLKDVGRDGAAHLGTWLSDHGITLYHSVPTLYRHLCATLGGDEDFDRLRWIVLGGEEARSADVELLRRHFSARAVPARTVLVNVFGATESTLALRYFAGPATEPGRAGLPAGWPVSATEVLLLNAGGRQVAVYGVGEILVRSPQLALGYQGRPGSTAAAFRPDPEGGPQRVYHTGDLGRLLPDGSIEFVGRGDRQVKVRGYRVEVAEVEKVLERHPDVRSAVVGVREDAAGDRQLAAWIVARRAAAAPLSFRELGRWLREAVPDYMVPAAWVALERLPLTSTGKVDRRRLPAPGPAGPEPAETFVAPRDPVERAVAETWCEVLGLERVGVSDSFFELGGHSLLATQVASRLFERLAVEVPLRRFFEDPTVAGLARAVAERRGAADTARPDARARKIRRRAPSAHDPLSFAQHRLWFLHRLTPESPYYNMPRAVRFIGRLRPGVLRRVLQEIVRRHESLRTRFALVDAEPVQVVTPVPRLLLPVVDLRPLAAAAAGRAEARRLGTAFLRRPFDLERGPLLRLLLVRLSGREHVLFLSVHHIVSDGWSMMVLFHEVGALYEAYAEGRPSPLPEPPVQYADFALWQREWLGEEVLEAQLAYWRRRMAGAPGRLELPADRPRPAVQSLAGDRLRFTLTRPLHDALEELSAKRGVSLYMTLVSAFQALLHHYTGARDLVLGSPIANRHTKDLEGLIGFFVNMLLLRTDLSGDPTFAELLRRVQEGTLAGYDHQDLPFERLVEALQPERDLSTTPLFQVMFNLLNFPQSVRALPELVIDPWHIDTGTSKYDLSLYFLGREEVLTGVFEYSTDLFDRVTVERMAAHLKNVLEAVVHDPGSRLGRLPLLVPAERQEVLVERNDAEPESAEAPLHVHGLFEARAGRCPDTVAVVVGGAALTYRGLDRRADRLARWLRRIGVGTRSLVGLSMERSGDMVVGLLAVLKTGGAYLPLDPSYPAARLAFMLADARPEVLLTHSPVRGTLPGYGGAIVCLDRLAEAGERREALPALDLPGQLAYVIYTSGSTGRPKGVAVPHASVVNFLRSMARRPGLTAEDVFLSVTTLSFDIAALELFLPLMVGARLVLASREETGDGGRLAARLAASRASAMQATPATWGLLLEAGPFHGAGFRVLCGGEALPRELAERLLESGAEVWNLYGPTETTIWSAVHRVSSGHVSSGGGSVPLGRPVAGTSLYLLDRGGRPVVLGVAGELSIGGAGLARGYLGRPGLTAERFVADPFSRRGGARLYRTGDLARYRAGGGLEFLGRLDHQVKVRGFRIESGEVEAHLAEHPAVRSAVVVARRGSLAAYLVPHGTAPSVEALRRFLGARLPEHMVPSSFVVLERFPLTAAGKVDRRALPEADGRRAQLETGYQAPRTALERYLAAAWRKVLGLERIGVRDRFFDLGGNSIQAAVFVNRLQQELGEVLHVTALFRAQSITQLVALLEKEYPRALQRWGEKHERTVGALPAPLTDADEGIDAFKILEMRRRAARRRPRRGAARQRHKNPPAVFILSPPRSGSTLLRVMLAGHPRLFSPPELELLGYDTLGERAADLAGPHSFATEGLLRAVMELKGCDVESARALMADHEARDLPVERFYGLLQEWSGSRTLVDKTTTYALDPGTLERAEEIFEAPLYIHLPRHPCATVKSYVDVHLDQFLRFETPFTPRQQAELLWVVDHQNILRFLAGVPRGRQLRVRFEDLLERPREVLGQVCAFLGLELAAPMLEPYAGRKMTDGLYAESRMHGDPRFHEHTAIEPSVAEKWKGSYAVSGLAEITRQMMESFGYPAEDEHPSLAIPPRTGTESDTASRIPLSFAQERLWLLHQIEPDNPAYNIASAARLRGRLDAAVLRRAFGAVAERHATLRTGFYSVDGLPFQRVEPAASPALPSIDLRRLSGSLRDAEAERLLRAESRRRFDLSRAPLWRTRLLELGPRHHVLLVTVHHAVADGWSLGVLVKEVTILYEVLLAGVPSPLPELAVRYPDFAAWQRRELTGETLESHLAYWRDKLAGLATLELAADRPRPPVQTFHGASWRFTLPPQVSAALAALARRRGVSLFMLLLAAFKALLARHGAQQDVVVGAPVANRPRRELEGLIGPFINTLVLRTDTSGDPVVRDLLARVRATVLEAFAHQELPFERLVEALSPRRDLSRNPLFQVLFNFLDTPVEKVSLSGLELEPVKLDGGASQFDLTLFWTVGERGLGGRLEYNTDLFDRSRVRRLAGHLQSLLRGIVARPESRLSRLPIHSPAEVQQLLREWNDTESAAPGQLVHELFEAQVGRTPEAVAVSHGGRQSSYGGLNGRANALAHRLRGIGVGPEVLVGVALARSARLPAALLGVLKAGGAYVPLDPSYPARRLVSMLEGSAVRVLLSDQGRALSLRGDPEGGDLPETAPEVIDVTRLDAVARRPPRSAARVGQTAYVIYTSGSTGRPKGVEVTHAGVVSFLRSMAREPGLTAADTLAAVTTLAFDIAVLELFLPLSVGARVAILGRDEAADPRELARCLADSRATVMQATPATWQMLSDAGWDNPSGIKVLCGGEALAPALAERLAACSPSVWNLYGPTETTVWSTFARVGKRHAEPGPSSIGRPIAGTRTRVLDRRWWPAPLGVPGELAIGGLGVSRGYRGRPARVAAAFVPDPFGREAGGRLYRTGDLARFDARGRLEFLGRIDHQVKVRGFRVEPGEIEAALVRHPGVRQAVVLARRDRPGEAGAPASRLVAYLVAAGGSAPGIGALRRFLAEWLPPYMLPSAVVVLDALPLSANGKVDRRRLPAPEAGRPELEKAFVAPRGPVEEAVAETWCQILGLERVGAEDNFFELGGHSLLATQVASRLFQTFEMQLPLRRFFADPTVAGLAGMVREAQLGKVDEAKMDLLARVESLSEEEIEDEFRRLRGTARAAAAVEELRR